MTNRLAEVVEYKDNHQQMKLYSHEIKKISGHFKLFLFILLLLVTGKKANYAASSCTVYKLFQQVYHIDNLLYYMYGHYFSIIILILH